MLTEYNKYQSYLNSLRYVKCIRSILCMLRTRCSYSGQFTCPYIVYPCRRDDTTCALVVYIMEYTCFRIHVYCVYVLRGVLFFWRICTYQNLCIIGKMCMWWIQKRPYWEGVYPDRTHLISSVRIAFRTLHYFFVASFCGNHKKPCNLKPLACYNLKHTVHLIRFIWDG